METNKEHNLILAALLVILVLVGGFLWFRSHDKPDNDTNAAPKVEVTNVLESEAKNKLPEGFPRTIPVEQGSITESYKAVYTDRGVTQYTVSYISTKSKDALIKLYSDFYDKYGFDLNTSATNKSLGQFSGTSFNDTLNVVISKQGDSSLVQINLLSK